MARGQSPAPSVVALAADASLVSSSVSARSAMEAADVPVMFVAVQQKLNRKRFDDLSSTPPSESSAGRGYRLVLRTPSELRLQGCDLDQIESERRPNRHRTGAQPLTCRSCVSRRGADRRFLLGTSRYRLIGGLEVFPKQRPDRGTVALARPHVGAVAFVSFTLRLSKNAVRYLFGAPCC